MSTAINGADVLLLVNTGTTLAPIWTPVGSQRDVTFTESTEPIDKSNKTDGRIARFLPGRMTGSIDLEALYVPTDVALGLIRQSSRTGTPVQARRHFAGDDIEQAECIITNLADTHPDQDVSTIALTLQVDGPWASV